MSRIWARFAGIFSKRIIAGGDKVGNKYFSRTEEIDGIMKEKRWVVFKGEEDPTSIPVEWICWLNGQRKSAPTPEELAILEAKRETVKLNVARLKKEEEEKKAREGSTRKTNINKTEGPDLKSFMQQFPDASAGDELVEPSETRVGLRTKVMEQAEIERTEPEPESSEPSGSGASYRPGTWQPPT